MNNNPKWLLSFLLFLCIIPQTYSRQLTNLWLDEMDIKSFSEGIPSIVKNTNAGGDSIRLGGATYKRGVGVQSLSVVSFLLDGNAKEFSAIIGADDKTTTLVNFNFFVIGDKKILFESGIIKAGSTPKKVKVDLTNVKRLGLLVQVNDHHIGKAWFNWANAQFVMLGDQLPQHIPNNGERYILTPTSLKTPKINSAKIFGVTPGNPFLYTIAATGERPMTFSAENLPAGLLIDQKTGIITGSVQQKGLYVATLKASNSLGEAKETLRIKVGDTIALTPPIGWNGWNSWAREIDGEKVMASANAMVKMGLKDHGWTYINIDDAWQGQRGGKYNAILPNEKFPDFKKMIDYVHNLGLKLGVYSTPWITSYAGYAGGSSIYKDGKFTDSIRNNKRSFRYIGQYRFEENDAKQMADWGVDYLKYDWRLEVPSAERMSKALKKSGRDILYSLSNSAPFANAKDWARISNTYRTGPDIRDSWTSLYLSAFTIDKWAPFGGPGHWNDPDMMILGNVTTGSKLHPTKLTPDEQYSHVSLFSLLAAPLLIGCPIEQLDAFTLNLLTNDEVVAVNQDPLGKPGRLVYDQNGVQVWLKPLEDGSYAAGLFNINGFATTPQTYFRWGDEEKKSFDFDFAKLGLKGKWKLRDVWKQENIGVFNETFKTDIPHHGVVMLRLFPQ
ncbi:NPCBM/NEW2 domain-containing protein [Segetibacter sp.]|uniref:NPCBM/NEW2 domain-containing protein n=1 Tax=Segetibacter sp. TaxID=2231182 RepID=UPI002636D932|nr:NPCBM/NEW2 domain-containing protein [Segetibacter sp.]MCW3081132.1 Alpha-galactosidase [Segetibacter sp.]